MIRRVAFDERALIRRGLLHFIISVHINSVLMQCDKRGAFGGTQHGLKPTIYGNRGNHANHYITDVVVENNVDVAKLQP
jgi:hypothetical protein